MKLLLKSDGICLIEIGSKEILDDVEKEELINFIKGQLSDGWGESNFEFQDSEGNYFSVSFWSIEHGWYIKYKT